MDYAVAAGEVGAYEKVLSASAVDEVTFADPVSEVEIISDGAASIFVSVRADDSDPTVGGAHFQYLPAAPCARRLPLSTGTRSVRLISAGTPTYSVARVP